MLMLVDTMLTTSHWQVYVMLLLAALVIGLVGMTSFTVWYKLFFMGVFICALLIQKKYWRPLRVTQLWQMDSQHWALRYHDDVRAYPAKLARIQYCGWMVTLTFLVSDRQQALTIWRDQMSHQQWRYLKMLAHLKKNNLQTPYD